MLVVGYETVVTDDMSPPVDWAVLPLVNASPVVQKQILASALPIDYQVNVSLISYFISPLMYQVLNMSIVVICNFFYCFIYCLIVRSLVCEMLHTVCTSLYVYICFFFYFSICYSLIVFMLLACVMSLKCLVFYRSLKY